MKNEKQTRRVRVKRERTIKKVLHFYSCTCIVTYIMPSGSTLRFTTVVIPDLGNQRSSKVVHNSVSQGLTNFYKL